MIFGSSRSLDNGRTRDSRPVRRVRNDRRRKTRRNWTANPFLIIHRIMGHVARRARAETRRQADVDWVRCRRRRTRDYVRRRRRRRRRPGRRRRRVLDVLMLMRDEDRAGAAPGLVVFCVIDSVDLCQLARRTCCVRRVHFSVRHDAILWMWT